jgi:hypothetical protein
MAISGDNYTLGDLNAVGGQTFFLTITVEDDTLTLIKDDYGIYPGTYTRRP